MSSLRGLVGSLSAWVLLGIAAAGAEPGTWRAGWSRANITPEQPMWMAGYSARDHAAEGKLTDLWAKVLVLQPPEGDPAVLITLDLVGIDRTLSERLCRAISERYGWSRAQIAICTSHTHTGPVVGGNLQAMHYRLLDDQQRRLVDLYAKQLEEKILEATAQAAAEPMGCRVQWGVGKATFAVNRRNNPESKVPELRARGRLAGPVDHDVPVLSIRDEQDRLRVVVFGYACHATVLSFYQWSGDYPGFAQMALERMFPDCQAMFFAGCGADQNPLPRRTVELAKHYGDTLAQAVADVLAAPMEELGPRLECRYQEIPLKFAQVPQRAQLEQEAQSSNRYVAARAKMWLEHLDDGGQLPAVYPYPVGVWRVGDQWEWYFLGGEVVVDYALRIKAERHGVRSWVAGYANDVMAYIPSRRVLLEGGYEGGGAMVYYGLLSPWDISCEDDIITAVTRLALPPQ
ncbi:MAG: hypothetical protein KatS3mg110_2928 [Pirellulaceae bacterium]|nr:MAG: hypothetical protein KatS3mg110_2928 [Pirellulaceae bacterium]